MTNEQLPPTEHFEEGNEAPPPGVEWMATFRWMILIFFAALALFMVARELGIGSDKMPREAAHQQKYYCPMHPQIVQDEPGKCPICSMDLVLMPSQLSESQPSDSQPSDSMPSESQPTDTMQAPPKEATLSGLAEVTLTPERIQKIGLTTTKATLQSFSDGLSVVGIIESDDARMAEVHTRSEGFIEYIKPLRVGDFVKKGELLATIYSKEVDEAEREYLLLKQSTNAHGAEALLEAAKARLKTLKISAYEIAAIEKAGKSLPLSITATSSGIITEKNALLGAFVTPETMLFATADLSVVFAVLNVPEQDIARIKVGQSVSIQSKSSSKEFTGKIAFIYPTLDKETRTRKVRIELANPEQELLPGMFITAEIQSEAVQSLAVSRDAVIETGERTYVFVAKGQGQFSPQIVTTGGQQGDLIEILSGLKEGDVVVLSAGFLLDSESRLHGGMK